MEGYLIEDAVWQRMLAALETVPYMPLNDLERLGRFVSACFVVMWTNLTWAKRGVFDRLMECSQPVAASDVLHIDSPGAFAKRNAGIMCHRTATEARGWGEEAIGRLRGGLTTKVHHAVDGPGFIRRQLISPGLQADCKQAEALTAGLQPLSVLGDKGYDSDKAREHWRLYHAQAQPFRAALVCHGALPHPAPGRELVQPPERLPPPQPAAGKDRHQFSRVCSFPQLAVEG